MFVPVIEIISERSKAFIKHITEVQLYTETLMNLLDLEPVEDPNVNGQMYDGDRVT